MIDNLSKFLMKELNLKPDIDQTTLDFRDYSSPSNVYADIGVYNFKNSNHKYAIECKIKEKYDIPLHKSLNEVWIKSSMKFNSKHEGAKKTELKFYFISRILSFEDAIQVNRAIFPDCLLN